MEVAAVRQQILNAIDRAKRTAAERRIRTDEAAREYEVFLEQLAIPLFRQAANVLRVENYLFALSTPGGSVRLMSDRSADDYIELILDPTSERPTVVGRTSRAWGRRTAVSEQALNPAGPIRDLTEDDVLAFLLKALEPFVEK
jgi:hypothetical protein